MTNEIQLYIIGVLVLTILVLYIRDYFTLKELKEEIKEWEKELEEFDYVAENNFELLKLEYNKKLEELENKNKWLKYSIASYKWHNNRYREEIKKLKNRKDIKEFKESVQKDCTKNTNLTNKADDKQRETTTKDKRVDKRKRKNDRKKK